jgi:hypothetical protein
VDSVSVIIWKERSGIGVRKEAALTRGAMMSAIGRQTPMRAHELGLRQLGPEQERKRAAPIPQLGKAERPKRRRGRKRAAGPMG